MLPWYHWYHFHIYVYIAVCLSACLPVFSVIDKNIAAKIHGYSTCVSFYVNFQKPTWIQDRRLCCWINNMKITVRDYNGSTDFERNYVCLNVLKKNFFFIKRLIRSWNCYLFIYFLIWTHCTYRIYIIFIYSQFFSLTMTFSSLLFHFYSILFEKNYMSNIDEWLSLLYLTPLN